MSYDYDAVVYIGRFQLFHIGHLTVAEKALSIGRRLVFVLGSSFQARTEKNVWRHDEREEMIRAAFPQEQQGRIDFAPVPDTEDDPSWVRAVHLAVGMVLGPRPGRIALIGHEKDDSSYYLSMFPNWAREEMPSVEGISATPIRAEILGAERPLDVIRNSRLIPNGVRDWLIRHFDREGEKYRDLVCDEEYVRSYKRDWAPAPFAPVLVTTDVVVFHRGRVLLVRRRGRPGFGLQALPGGFVEQDGSLAENALRELNEETGLDLRVVNLTRGKDPAFFMDNPNRSRLGRAITGVFISRVPWWRAAPAVEGGDDAESAKWELLDVLCPYSLFEDHWSIIDRAVREEGSLWSKLRWRRASSAAHKKIVALCQKSA